MQTAWCVLNKCVLLQKKNTFQTLKYVFTWLFYSVINQNSPIRPRVYMKTYICRHCSYLLRRLSIIARVQGTQIICYKLWPTWLTNNLKNLLLCLSIICIYDWFSRKSQSTEDSHGRICYYIWMWLCWFKDKLVITKGELIMLTTRRANSYMFIPYQRYPIRWQRKKTKVLYWNNNQALIGVVVG